MTTADYKRAASELRQLRWECHVMVCFLDNMRVFGHGLPKTRYWQHTLRQMAMQLALLVNPQPKQ